MVQVNRLSQIIASPQFASARNIAVEVATVGFGSVGMTGWGERSMQQAATP